MMKEKRIKRKKSQIMMARSRIYGFFLKAASFLFEKSEKSLAAKIFTGYDETSFEKSIICRFFKIFKLDRIFFRPLKRNTSKYVSQSYIVGKLDDFFQGFLHTKLNVYGLLLITTGIGLLFVELLKVYTSRLSFLSYIDIFVCVFLILISLPLLFSSSSFNSAVCKSKIAQYVMFQWFGFKREAFESDNGTEGYTKIAIPLGIILCVLSPTEWLFWCTLQYRYPIRTPPF